MFSKCFFSVAKHGFQQAETGFDKLFGYNRQLSETFEYCNSMKNGTISEKLQMQERELNMPKTPLTDEITTNKIPKNQNSSVETFEHTNIPTFDQSISHSINQSGLASLFSILAPKEKRLKIYLIFRRLVISFVAPSGQFNYFSSLFKLISTYRQIWGFQKSAGKKK